MKPRIAIVNSSSFGKLFPEHLERLRSLAEMVRITVAPDITAAAFAKELRGVHGIVASVSPRYGNELLRSLSELVVIARHGIGYDNVDVKAASELGIMVSRVPGIAEQEAVAEHTLALMLSVSRQLVQARDAVVKGLWNTRAQFIGVELRNKRIGLLGIGNVGRRVAEILTRGFGAEVVAFDPFLTEQEIAERGARRISFEDLLTSCEIISLHCSLNDSNLRCLGQREFSMMKKGVIIVNTSRAELINQAALLQALERGFIGAYGADVAEGAPGAIEQTLLRFPNVLIVPHLAAYTLESLRGMGEAVVRDMEQVFLHRQLPDNVIDRSRGEQALRRWA